MLLSIFAIFCIFGVLVAENQFFGYVNACFFSNGNLTVILIIYSKQYFYYTDGSTTAKYYFTKNVLGDIVSIRDASGNIVGTYAYDAYGNCTVVSSSDANILAYNSIKYRGYYYDSVMGLYWLQTRYYDPNTGRFISPDATQYLDTDTVHGVNLYAYCGNCPTMFEDPSGHISELVIALIVGAVIGAVIGGVYGGISAVSQGASATEVLGSIVIGIFTGAIMGAGAGVGGFLVGNGVSPTILGLLIGAGTGALGGAFNETFSQLLYYGEITDVKSIGISAGINAGINTLGTLLGSVGGRFSPSGASVQNMWLGYIGIDSTFGFMTSSIVYTIFMGINKKRRYRS